MVSLPRCAHTCFKGVTRRAFSTRILACPSNSVEKLDEWWKKKKDERVNGWHLERNLIQLTSDRVHYVIIFIERVSKEGQSSLDDVIINLNLKYWKKMRKWRGSCNNLKKYKFFPHRINLDCDLFSRRCLFLQVLSQSSMTLYDRISPSVSPVFTVFYQ